jgi:phage baseplate assembly protein gpV
MVIGYFISRDGSYHEGDGLTGDVAVTQRPDWTYDWAGNAWVVNGGRAALVSAAAALDVDLSAVKADGPIGTFLKMSPAQIDSYITLNVTNLAGAVAVLRVLAKVVAVMARAQITQ